MGQDRRSVQQGAFAARTRGTDELPPEERAEVQELKRRDQEVRTHEAAHISAGGAYVRGGASYSYQAGPDGKRYAVGGEVSIDASSVPNNPDATIAKMQTVRRAALAPAQPSGQDLSVAARAAQAEIQARAEAAQLARSERGEQGDPSERGERVEAAEPGSEDAAAGGAGAAQPTAAMTPTDVVGAAAVGARLDRYA